MRRVFDLPSTWASGDLRALARSSQPRWQCEDIGLARLQRNKNRRLDFLIGPTDDLQLPSHLRLALLNAEPPVDHRKFEHRPRLVAAATLRAVGKTRLVEI